MKNKSDKLSWEEKIGRRGSKRGLRGGGQGEKVNVNVKQPYMDL